MNLLIRRLLIGFAFATIFGTYGFYLTGPSDIAWKCFNVPGMVFAPFGAALLWVLEAWRWVSDPGMVSGFVMFFLGGYIFWGFLFALFAKYVSDFKSAYYAH